MNTHEEFMGKGARPSSHTVLEHLCWKAQVLFGDNENPQTTNLGNLRSVSSYIPFCECVEELSYHVHVQNGLVDRFKLPEQECAFRGSKPLKEWRI